jgi:hypothetical protein
LFFNGVAETSSVLIHIVPPAVKEEFDLGIRNDIRTEGEGWHCGWKEIKAVDLELAGKEN